MNYTIRPLPFSEMDFKLTGLPFIRDEKKRRNFWAVDHLRTGDYGVDCNTGAYLAVQFLGYARNQPGPLLTNIVRDMGNAGDKFGGIEIGFLSVIEDAARRGAA